MGLPEKKMTRDEVRERLAERTKSIASRVEALETELPVKPSTLKKLISRKDQIRKGVAIGAGVVAVLLVMRRRKPSGPSYQDGVERIADSIAHEVRKNLRSGMDERDAVHSALEKRPPVVRVGGSGGGRENSGPVAAFLKQLVVSLGPTLVELLADILKGGTAKGSEK